METTWEDSANNFFSTFYKSFLLAKVHRGMCWWNCMCNWNKSNGSLRSNLWLALITFHLRDGNWNFPSTFAVKTDLGSRPEISLAAVHNLFDDSAELLTSKVSWKKYISGNDKEIKFKIMQNIRWVWIWILRPNKFKFLPLTQGKCFYFVCAWAEFKTEFRNGNFMKTKAFIVVYSGSCVESSLFDKIIVTTPSSVHLNN